jgi:hypothetical protein
LEAAAARPALDRRTFLTELGVAAGVAATSASVHAVAHAAVASATRDFGSLVARSWFRLALPLVRETSGFAPPVASRAFGYMGVTLYEAVVPGMPGYRSLGGRLTGLPPQPAPAPGRLHWQLVANAALAEIVRRLFRGTSDDNKKAIASLRRRLRKRYAGGVSDAVRARSSAWGEAVAARIYAWSKSDGGHNAYLNNFPAYDPPVGRGLWVPTPPSFLPALLPGWGSHRAFVVRFVPELDPGPPPDYSEDPSSEFYEQGLEVYETDRTLTREQEKIARFWSDDPAQTPTPPGHSISILTQVLRNRSASLAVAAKAYARVGMAVADAFICCWDTKYRYNLLRPVTYIRRLFDAKWLPLLVTPPFPEYASGHSVQSGAAAEVLTNLFGSVSFTDHTHDNLGFEPRSFHSFWDAAREAAASRLYGGIHFRAAIRRGLAQGKSVGEQIDALRLRA